MGNQEQQKAMLVFIATVTFTFAVIKMPLEMALLLRASPEHHSIHDFYNHRARSAVDQHIDAARSYHFFHRDLQAVDSADNTKTSKLVQEDAELSKKVQEIVSRYIDDRDKETQTEEEKEDQKQGNLRVRADNESMFTQKVQQLVQRYAAKHAEKQEEMIITHKDGIPHERKQDDPFDEEFASEIQEIVTRYTDKQGN